MQELKGRQPFWRGGQPRRQTVDAQCGLEWGAPRCKELEIRFMRGDGAGRSRIQVAVKYGQRCEIESVGDLVDKGIVSLATGDEIGRLNYRTGSIPFVRTSDFGSWELKRESKQGVSETVYAEWQARQDV